MCKKKCKTQSHTLPQHTIDKIKLRNNLRRQWQRNRDTHTKSVVNKLTREILHECTLHKNKSFGDRLAQLNHASKQFWHITKIIKNRHNIMPPLRDPHSNKKLFSNTKKAAVIAESFEKAHHTTHQWHDASVANIVNASTQKISNTTPDILSSVKYFTKPREIKQIIRNLKNKKAPGEDGINNIIIKHLPTKAIVLLAKLYNACMAIGYFPTAWKSAKVIAIPKPNKDNTNPLNYRPISLLSSLSKIL